MEYVLGQLAKQVSECEAEMDHFQSIVNGAGFGSELRERAREQIQTWLHRREQCENALLILEMTCCKKDEAGVS